MMRLGRISYINCYPVYKAIDRGIVELAADLVTGTPVELNDLLAAGALDVSVVSAVEYARNAKDYHLLPNLAISCDGPVRSVCLFSHCAVQDLDGETILVSASSRTSVHLLELLCNDQWKVRPKLVEARAEGGDLDALAALPHKAVLVIGDAALLLSARGSYEYQYDLGEEWKRWTGLPFVFAVWASRRSADAEAVAGVHASLIASRDWGLAHLEDLAEEALRTTNIDLAVCRTYLSGLDYAFSYRHLEGLTSFFRRLAARGTVRDGTLSFLSVA
jgi:chorismate dehydratase